MQRRFHLHSWLFPVALLSLSATAQASFSVTSATALPATVAPGQSIAISTSVKSSAAASNMVVDLELYNASGVKLAQTFYSGQTFSQSQTRAYSWSYKIPSGTAVGKYTLM